MNRAKNMSFWQIQGVLSSIKNNGLKMPKPTLNPAPYRNLKCRGQKISQKKNFLFLTFPPLDSGGGAGFCG